MTAEGHAAAPPSDFRTKGVPATTGTNGLSSSTGAGVPLTSSHQHQYQHHQPTHTSSAAPPLQAGASTAPGSHSGTAVPPVSSFSSTGTGNGTDNGPTPTSGGSVIPGHAQVDPEIPKTAAEAPVFGVEAAKDVSFGEQVKGHAKYFAGKVFGRDHEVQQGAAKLRGEEHSLPEDVKHPKTKAAEAAATPSTTKGATSTTGAQIAGPTQTSSK